jgi:nucleotide-binding universal stress UspA family protein/uncharacterized membrane protein
MGTFGRIIFLLGGLFSTMSALNATIYSSSRVSFAMGRDHNLPGIFAKIHPKKRTPHMAVFISGIFVALMAVTLPIEDIASATDAMFLLLFVFVNLAVINLRRNRPDLDRGFRVPLVPFIPLLATVINLGLAVVLFFYRPLGVWVCVGYLMLGIALYYLYARKKEFSAKAEPVIHSEHPLAAVDPSNFHILVPVANAKTVHQLQRLAMRLAKSHEADITVLNVIQVPSQTPPSEGRKYLGAARALLSEAITEAEDQGISVYSLVKLTHNIPKAVIETCEERKIDLMILGWEGAQAARNRVFGTKLDEILLNTICDIALVCKSQANDAEIKKVLIPVSSIKFAILSLKIAEDMFPEKDVLLVLFHATPYDDLSERREKFAADLKKFSDKITPERFQLVFRKTYSASKAIFEEAPNYDMIIMGAPEEGLLKRALFGDLPNLIAKELDVPIILTKKYHGHVKSWFQKFFGTRKTMLD